MYLNSLLSSFLFLLLCKMYINKLKYCSRFRNLRIIKWIWFFCTSYGNLFHNIRQSTFGLHTHTLFHSFVFWSIFSTLSRRTLLHFYHWIFSIIIYIFNSSILPNIVYVYHLSNQRWTNHGQWFVHSTSYHLIIWLCLHSLKLASVSV